MGVLDEMTKGITDRKAEKSAKLTPVGLENSPTKPSLGIPDVPAVFLTAEAVADMAASLRAYGEQLIQIADDLKGYDPASGQVASAKDEAVEQKLAEKEADRRAADREAAAAGDKKAAARTEFAENFDRMKAEAQAAVYGEDTVGEPHEGNPNTPDVTDGWTCPTHGDEFIGSKTTRAGKTYRLCNEPTCDQYES